MKRQFIRTFIAFELPEAVTDHLGAIQTDLQHLGAGIRWVRPRNIHLTLKFLGDLRPADLQAIESALNTAVLGQAPIRLAVKGIGVFPAIRKPRVIWAGLIDQVPQLQAFQRRLENLLDDCGFAREERPFKAHLTLGRVKGRLDVRNLEQAMGRHAEKPALGFLAERAVVFQSDLQPGGAVYTPLHRAALGLTAKPG